MIMVTGGAFQGKKSYAAKKFGISAEEIADGISCGKDAALTARCISNYHELVRRLGEDCISFTEQLCRKNKEAVIIIGEIGCGIVPMEGSERAWRENVGRCGCIIAANSERVIRMVCGIPTVIKGESE